MELSGQTSLSSSTTSLPTSTDSFDSTFNDFRAKIDRKLLVEMLDGTNPSVESAEDFFIRVSNASGAVISFPKKRKLEFMGKKDPEIRILGTPLQIRSARKLIMDAMDPHRNRITLKIDVSHTDHSHIIGKGGKRIQSIMDLTETHIHFPDENRNNALEKSNLVTISGNSLRKAEEARQMIRHSLPLTVSFQLDVNAGNIGLLDNSHPTIQYYQNRYNVLITFKSIDSAILETKLAIVQLKGTRLHFQELREATRALYQYLNWSPIGFNSTIITVNIEIAPQHHSFVMGRGCSNLKSINEHTGAIISFPNMFGLTETQSRQMSTVSIRGRGIESAFMAWLELLGYLPVILVFEVVTEEINGHLITSLMSNHSLTIKVCPKMNSDNKILLIKSQERNSSLLLEARQRILGIRDETPTVFPPESYPNAVSGPTEETGRGFAYFPYNFNESEAEVLRSHKNFFENH